jgi:hypothetical protein
MVIKDMLMNSEEYHFQLTGLFVTFPHMYDYCKNSVGIFYSTNTVKNKEYFMPLHRYIRINL